MADIFMRNLPPVVGAIQDTDTMILSRDGEVVNRFAVSELKAVIASDIAVAVSLESSAVASNVRRLNFVGGGAQVSSVDGETVDIFITEPAKVDGGDY